MKFPPVVCISWIISREHPKPAEENKNQTWKVGKKHIKHTGSLCVRSDLHKDWRLCLEDQGTHVLPGSCKLVAQFTEPTHDPQLQQEGDYQESLDQENI